MNETITCVVLPGLGPVCVECFSRGHIAAFPLSPVEIYSFGTTEPAAELSWNIDQARALIAARPRAALPLDPVWLRGWLAERSGFTPEHLDHIPDDRLAEPGILVELMACPPGGEPEPFRILIDGTHRAARRLRDGQKFWAYLLTEEEQRAISTYRRGGDLTAMPTFPGPGISDLEAGILATSPRGSDLA